MATSAGSIALALEGRAAMVTASAVRTYGLTPLPRRSSGQRGHSQVRAPDTREDGSSARARREPSALIRNQHWKRRKRTIVPARAWAGASRCRAFDSGSCSTPHPSDAMARAPGGTRRVLREGVCLGGERDVAVAQERLFLAPPSNRAR